MCFFFYSLEQLLAKVADMNESILAINEQMMQLGKEVHSLKTASSSEQKLNQLSKQVGTLTASNSNMSAKLDQTINTLKRGK